MAIPRYRRKDAARNNMPSRSRRGPSGSVIMHSSYGQQPHRRTSCQSWGATLEDSVSYPSLALTLSKAAHYTLLAGYLPGAAMPLSAVIVDDEQLARDELAYLLKGVGDVNVVAQGKNGLEAVQLIREHNPDLVFLDVQMPGLDGFGVIKKLLDKKVTLPKIVFSTAFDQYA